jgi:hypothetical protein
MEQQFVNLLLSTIAGLFGIVGAGVTWWVNNIWSMVKAQQQDISNLHIKLAEGYVPRAELQDAMNRIFNKLDEIQKEVRK